MGRAIGADQTGAVYGEAHGQVLNGDIMHHLVISALQEGRVNRGKRFIAFGRHTGGEGNRVLLGNADIKGAVGIGFCEFIQSRTRRHGGGDGDDFVVPRRFLNQCFGKNAGIAGRTRLGFLLLTGHHIKFRHAVIFIGRGLGRRIAMALFGDHMHEHRAVLHLLDVFQYRQQMVEIMAVNRTDIVKAHFFKQRAAGHEAACIFFDLPRPLFQTVGQIRGHIFQQAAE